MIEKNQFNIYDIPINTITEQYMDYLFAIFFFQAEDGIRDLYMTGVQTCALPICTLAGPSSSAAGAGVAAMPDRSSLSSTHLVECSPAWKSAWRRMARSAGIVVATPSISISSRSEERRVGKECMAS